MLLIIFYTFLKIGFKKGLQIISLFENVLDSANKEIYQE